MRTSEHAQITFRRVLQRRFSELKANHSGYSLRQLAKDLDQKPAALSQIFSGKRNVSARMAKQLSERMGLNGRTLKSLERAFSDKPSGKQPDTIAYGRMTVELDQFEVIAEWEHYAILSLATTDDFDASPASISRRLAIPISVVRRALARLESLRLLIRNSKGELIHAGTDICSTDGIRNLALRRRNETNLESARRSLVRHGINQHDFTFMTLATTPAKLKEAKKRIRQFANELTQFLEEGSRTEVYEFCTQLFPRTSLPSRPPKKGDAQ